MPPMILTFQIFRLIRWVMWAHTFDLLKMVKDLRYEAGVTFAEMPVGQPWDLEGTFLVYIGVLARTRGNLWKDARDSIRVAWMLAALVDVQFGAVPTAAVLTFRSVTCFRERDVSGAPGWDASPVSAARWPGPLRLLAGSVSMK